MTTEETCNQNLQTFHKAKKLTGSPCKAENLKIGSDNSDFDPSPQQYRNNLGYSDFVKNLLINFPHEEKMPIDTIIEPANPHAISKDHNYSVINLEDQFFKTNHLNEISKEDIECIEKETRDQDKSHKWKSERTNKII